MSLCDFTIFVNEEVIICNKAFSCCLSQAILQSVSFDTSIKDYHFKDVQNQQIFISFFNILFGESFLADSYTIREVIECFSITGSSFKIPYDIQDYDDVIWFLSLPFSKNQNEIYNKCITILIRDFQKFPTHLLQRLSSKTLELVFNNDSFIKPNDAFLFSLIFKDPSKYHLLRFINLFKIDFTIIQTFFNNLEANEIDLGLFLNFNQLFCLQ
jgi:hypothetical protein